MTNMIIMELTKADLTDAIHTLKAVFVDIMSKTDLPARSLQASLDPAIAAGHGDMKSVLWRKYWVAKAGEKVTGIVGLMVFEGDELVDWVNWFCVHPDYRGQGIGQMLLQKAIDESTARGHMYLKLWTTDAPNEIGAQKLYDKLGFMVTHTEPYIDGDAQHKIYRKKMLKS